MAVFQRKYNTATAAGTHIRIPLVKRGLVDFAVSADWTPAAGDCKLSKDGGAAANIGTLPAAVAMGNTAYWEFQLTAAELSCKQLVVTVADSATKAVEDQSFIVETFGDASAMSPPDFSDAVRLGLTALPNANAEAAGGLFTRGTGAGQINQDANGRIDANAKALLGTTLTEGAAGRLKAAFTTFFDVASPVLTTASVNQTGDNYARLGVPVGASISADIQTRSTYAGGTVASVTGAVGSVASGGIAAASLTTAALHAISDDLLDRDMAAGTDTNTRSPRNALRFLRNKWSVAGTTLTVTKEDDTTTAYTSTLTTADPATTDIVTGFDPT